MSEIALGLAVALGGAVLFREIQFYRFKKKIANLFQLLINNQKEQEKLNEKSYEVDSQLATQIEMLGVHTKLIPPTISMQAEAFLAWHNQQKEEEDGEIQS